MDLRDRMKARMSRQLGSWYEIRNATDDAPAVVRIYDEIGFFGVSADQFVRDLDALDADRIEVQINSPGGDVFDGIAIYNALRTHPASITTRVDGLAASAASVIAQAGEKRVMVEAAQMMIHDAWGVAIGSARELREFADVLEQQNNVLAGIYATRSGGEVDTFLELMGTETWLTDQAAVDLGLADEILVPEAAAAAAKPKGRTEQLVLAVTAEPAPALTQDPVRPAQVPPEILRDLWLLDHPEA